MAWSLYRLELLFGPSWGVETEGVHFSVEGEEGGSCVEGGLVVVESFCSPD